MITSEQAKIIVDKYINQTEHERILEMFEAINGKQPLFTSDSEIAWWMAYNAEKQIKN